MVHKSHASPNADQDFERQMEIARGVMDKDWIVLRALALGDQQPQLNSTELVKLAEQERSRS